MAARSGQKGQFQPGQSGNPSGRPKGLEKRAQEAIALRTYKAADGITYLGQEIALQVLVDIATNTQAKDRDRVAASQALLDRTIGRPKQSIEHDGELTVNRTVVQLPADLTDEQLEVLAKLDEGLSDDDRTD